MTHACLSLILLCSLSGAVMADSGPTATRPPAGPRAAVPAGPQSALAPARPRDAARWRRDNRTGAACTRFCVKTAAAVAGMPETIRLRSSRFAARMPA